MRKLRWFILSLAMTGLFSFLASGEIKIDDLIVKLNNVSSPTFVFDKQLSKSIKIDIPYYYEHTGDEYGSISYDGKYLLNGGHKGGYVLDRLDRILLIDIENNKCRVIDRKNRGRKDSLIDRSGHPPARYACWDPLNLSAFYMMNLEDTLSEVKNEKGVKVKAMIPYEHVWCLSVNDFSENEVMKPFDRMLSYIPSPDGKSLFMTGYNTAKHSEKQVQIQRQDSLIADKIDIPEGYCKIPKHLTDQSQNT